MPSLHTVEKIDWEEEDQFWEKQRDRNQIDRDLLLLALEGKVEQAAGNLITKNIPFSKFKRCL